MSDVLASQLANFAKLKYKTSTVPHKMKDSSTFMVPWNHVLVYGTLDMGHLIKYWFHNNFTCMTHSIVHGLMFGVNRQNTVSAFASLCWGMVSKVNCRRGRRELTFVVFSYLLSLSLSLDTSHSFLPVMYLCKKYIKQTIVSFAKENIIWFVQTIHEIF